MLIPAKQLRPGYRMYDPMARRMATFIYCDSTHFYYRIDHDPHTWRKPISWKVPVVSLGGVG